MLIALCGVDALSGAALRNAEVAAEGPGAVGVGETFAIVARIKFRGPAPYGCEVALGVTGPVTAPFGHSSPARRSEEHTSELQSQSNLVCRLLLEKKQTPRRPAMH